MSKKLSGAEYKKRAAKKQSDERELLKKVPKIGTFFTLTRSTSTSESESECQDVSTKPSTLSSAPSNFIQEQDLLSLDLGLQADQPCVTTNLNDEPEVAQEQLPLGTSSEATVTLPNSFSINDPATWNVKLNSVVENVIEHCPKQNVMVDFSKSLRTYNDGKRTLSQNMFKSTLPNGDVVVRNWLLYSQSTGKVFCIQCCLFQPENAKTHFSTGFNDWKHSYELLKNHENSHDHRRNTLTYITRQKKIVQVDKILFAQYEKEVNYWRSVLSRIVSVVRFLAVRGLPFQGDNENFGSTSNGLYLGCLELISEYDPFLAQHIGKYGNKGQGHTSYLSSQTCNEFIEVMGNCVLKTLVDEVKEARYYSLIVDSTPDCSHTDQLAIVLRYVPQTETEPKPVERLIKLLPGISHTSAGLENAVVGCLESFEINIKNCRGQSYDNASNMSGPYSGLQARIKQHSPLAEYIPCAAHSLNLVGSAAAECCTITVVFFGFVQELYNYFSVSTYRWSILKQSLAKNHTPVVKSLSETRWSARADAIRALVKGYEEIKESLRQLSEDPSVKPACRLEAQNLETKFQNFETTFLLAVWSDILERVDKCSKDLQCENLNLERGVKQLKTLEGFFKAKRDEFDDYEQSALIIGGYDVSSYSRIRKRKIFADETRGIEEDLDERTNLKNNVFLKIMDSLIANLARRKEAYEVVAYKFQVLPLLLTSSSETSNVKNAALKLCSLYPEDISPDFVNECIHFQMYVELEGLKDLPTVYSYIKKKLSSTFPNLEIAIRMFLTLPVTNCTAERDFSVLSRVKNAKRTTLQNEKLNSLVLLCTEKDLTLKTNFAEVVEVFARKKIKEKIFSGK